MEKSTLSVNAFGVKGNERVQDHFILYLYIAGSAFRSRRAVVNLRRICEQSPHNVYEIKVIDIFQQPDLAKKEQIFAVPTLIRKKPAPARFLIGDMSDTEAVLDLFHS